MGRANLGALLGTVNDPTAAPEAVAPPPTPTVEKPVVGASELAGYLRLVRKETRLREDQQNALTQHARRLNRARANGSPRITDNTLIRVAIDLLLDRIDTAAGDDEAAIRTSLRDRA